MIHHICDIYIITTHDCECTLRSGLGGTDTLTTLPFHTRWACRLIGCLLADMDCLVCPVGACSRERAVQAEGVGVSPHCSVALPS